MSPSRDPVLTRLLTRLLMRLLDADTAEAVLGDLQERRLRGFGLLRETVSAAWHLHRRPSPGAFAMSTFLGDVRHGARLLRRSPAFAVGSLLTLGLAIGATTAIFSIVEPVLLSPLPYPSAGRLVFVWEQGPDGSHDNIGFATIRDLTTQSQTIDRAAAIGTWQPTLMDAGDSERLEGERVSWTFFRILGVQPAIGRDFLKTEDAPDRNQVVILSYGLWQRRFGGDSSIVGRSILLDGNRMIVVGVLPQAFDNVAAPAAQIWRVLGYDTQPWTCRTCHHLRMLARIKAGVPLARAAAELEAIHERLAAAYPKEYETPHAAVVPMADDVRRDYRGVLVALGGAVCFLLLIAVANIVNLQLARSIRRETEFGVRAALGAGHSRLAAQLLAENLVLAFFGGTLGLLIAYATLPVLVAALPRAMPRLAAVHVSGPALAMVAVLVLVVSALMGVAPLRLQSARLTDALRSGRRSTGSRHFARSTLVVAEIALAVMLLAGAGLMARSIVRLLSVNAGFDPRHLLTLEINSVGANYRTDARIIAYHDRVREAVRALPGVADVAVANQLPLGGNLDMFGFIDADRPPVNPELVPSADRYTVSEEYQRTMRIPIVRGRWFTAAEARDSAGRVALVSAALAERMWPAQDAIGKHFRVGGFDAPVRTVIGVVGNVHHSSLDAPRMYQWYVPERQWLGADNQEVLIVRAAGDPASLATSVRRAIIAIDPTQPIVKLATMEQVIARSTGERRLALVLFAAFASAALLLSVAGIYGVLAGNVAERTREFGVRIAVGATPGLILRLVLSQAARLAGIGIVVGLAGALATTRYLRTLLYGVSDTDPTTLAGVVILLGVVIVAACLVPAYRAARVEPGTALRAE